MVTVDETFEWTGEVVVEYCMLRIAVLAVEESVGLGPGDIAYQMFEFVPVSLSGVDLVAAKTVEREGDVGSCALLQVAE